MAATLLKFKDQAKNDIPFNFIRHKGTELEQQVHMHDYFQIAYVMRGVCTHHFCNQTLTVGKGDIFLIPPLMEHSLNALHNKDFELIILDFIPYFIDDKLSPFSQTIYYHLLHQRDLQSQSEWLHPWLHIAQEKQLLVEQLLQDISDQLSSKEEGYEFSIQINLVNLLILIDREFRRSSRTIRPSIQLKSHQAQFDKVIRYLYDNYSQDISLEQAADIAHMTPAYFSHMFKKEVGQTFIEFMHEIRIERAMDMIRQNEHTVTQICFHVGFRNLSHFIRTFKKRTGEAPTAYKKLFFNNEK
ncbi:AraC family transcriptional regulator [Paenibacillus eucommiae]|uniref:AraC-like DNA-binding protein/mannose-6-phosphate isomerase-like protein (Cupin superfamily) n=1 Tax=Paenibacillus eucommiae TaxID=1355755 RepID=A0ABS4J1F1_9BACL|nr:helix-turn-helix domain-containing protein [Paenibacillus eucommiae]MBP1993654.1 AraC-like DNA-binding protein/mannose-6-phosphate isomerase-like protein (cupin superfamily) [Paenibacillus eucommiae]